MKLPNRLSDEEYDPAEDADSELGPDREEEDRRPMWQAQVDVAFVLGLEEMSDEALATLLTHAKEGWTRELAQAEQDTRAVERAAVDAQRYLDAHEGGWAGPNVELGE